MIKIFDANDRNFSSAGNIIIEPIKCNEFKKKSLNGWYIEVEIPIRYKEFIEKDKLCVVKTKSKLNPQAFRIGENIQYTTKKIKFRAEHVMFDAKDYVLLDVRPTKMNGLNTLNYINERTDNTSPFTMYSNIETIDTAYFIRKNLLEAWSIIEQRWGGVFDADNWNISFRSSVGNDNGETIAYGKNLQGFDIFEDWSSVCTKLCPVGYDGLMLPEEFLSSDVQYEKPYTRIIDFQTDLEEEEQTQENLLEELRIKAKAYLEENKVPKISYTIISNINEKLEIGDTIKVLHPFVDIFTEVLEYEYNLISKKVVSLTFGNYSRDVKTKFDNVKNTITQINQTLSKQESVINKQTNLINSLNKNGYVYIDENEVLILDTLPKEEAKNVWRFGLGGIGFSSNGYEGPFEIAMTMDGQINANFITTGVMSVSRIEGLANELSSITIDMEGISQTVTDQNNKIARVTQTVDELNSKIGDIADITISQESINGTVSFEKINQSEPIYVKIRPIGDSISYLYPHDNLFPSDTLFLKDRKLRFTNTTTKENIDYVLPDDLLYHDAENYDEFILDYDAQTCVVNKRVGYNADGTTYVLENPTTVEYDFPKIELTDGDYTVTMLGYPSSYLFVRLMSQNIYTTQFSTKAEVHSEISQMAQSINLSVDKKLENYSSTTQMNAAISLKAEEITSTVSKTYATKATTNSLSTRIKQTAKTVEVTATDNKTSAGITIKLKNEDGTQIDSASANITLSGLVKFTDLSESGTTTINGSNITTGTIDASKVTVKNLNASNITSGTLSANKINGGTITASAISLGSGKFAVTTAGALTATSGTIGGFTLGSTKLYNAKSTLTGSTAGVYIGTDGISLGENSTFKVTSAGVLTATNATISGTITAKSGTFENCTIKNNCTVPASTVSGTLAASNIPNLNASKITSGTMSGDRISGGTISGSSIKALTVYADSMGLNTEYGAFYVGDYRGQDAYIPVPTSITVEDGKIVGQTWRRLVFKCGILVAVQSSW